MSGPLTVNAAVGSAGASRLVLDARAWALLVRTVGVPGLPSVFGPGSWATGPGVDSGPVLDEATAAWGRLEQAGVVVAGGGPWEVHRGVLKALATWALAPVLVSVRSWSGECEVLAELTVVAGRGAGLARRRVLDGAGRVMGDESWVELAEFDAGAVVEEVARALPAEVVSGPLVGQDAGSVTVPWGGSLAVARAFRAGRGDLVDAVTRLEPEAVAAGLRSPLLRDAVAGLRGGAEVSVVVRGRSADGAAAVVRQWVGTWLVTADGLLSLALAPPTAGADDAQVVDTVGVHAGAPDEPDKPGEQDVQVDEPLVRLRRVSGGDVRADLLLAVTAAVDVAESLGPDRTVETGAAGAGAGAGGGAA